MIDRPNKPAGPAIKLVRLYSEGRLEEAIDLADALLIDRPDDTAVWRLKGLAHFQAKQFSQSMDCFDAQLELDGGNADAWRNKAICLAEQGFDADAVPVYATALQHAPMDPSTLNEMGKSLARIGRKDEAVRAFRDAVRANPNFSTAWSCLAETLGESEEALECLDITVRLDPTNADAWSNRGAWCLDAAIRNRTVSLLRESLRSFEEALKVEPLHLAASHNMCVLLERFPGIADNRTSPPAAALGVTLGGQGAEETE